MIQVTEKLEQASGELQGAPTVVTHTCTASYTVLSDKSTKLASVEEANITAMVDGMQRYLELLVREGERTEGYGTLDSVSNYKPHSCKLHVVSASCPDNQSTTISRNFECTVKFEGKK